MKKLKNSILLLLTLSLVIAATANLSPVYASPTDLSVVPAAVVGIDDYPINTLFSVNITVTSVLRLSGFEFKLGYDGTILENSTAIILGDFFGGPSKIGPMPDGPSIVWHNEMNNGLAWYAVTLGDDSPQYYTGLRGSGTLATIKFKVTGTGATILALFDTILANPEGDSIDHEAKFGVFSNVREPPTASLEAIPATAEIKQSIVFDASESKPYDPSAGQEIKKYVFDFGDGTPIEESVDRWLRPKPTTEHSYESVGMYTVSVTITDDIGAQNRAEVLVKIVPPSGAQAAIVNAEPAYRNIKVSGKELGINYFSLNPFIVDVQNLASVSVKVKVGFTVLRDGVKVATFETSPHTFAAGTYQEEYRFDTSTESPPKYETNLTIGKYKVTAQCFYLKDGKYVAGNTWNFGFRVTP